MHRPCQISIITMCLWIDEVSLEHKSSRLNIHQLIKRYLEICREQVKLLKSNLLFTTHTTVGTVTAYVQKFTYLISHRCLGREFCFYKLKKLLLNFVDVHSYCVL